MQWVDSSIVQTRTSPQKEPCLDTFQEYLIGDLVHEETISPMVWKNCAVLQVDILENKPFDTPLERISAMDHLFKACEGLSEPRDHSGEEYWTEDCGRL